LSKHIRGRMESSHLGRGELSFDLLDVSVRDMDIFYALLEFLKEEIEVRKYWCILKQCQLD
jgi:hypothetical protein